MERHGISFLRFILEAYDGIAILETINSASGLVILHIPPGCEDDVEMVLQDIQKDILIEQCL